MVAVAHRTYYSVSGSLFFLGHTQSETHTGPNQPTPPSTVPMALLPIATVDITQYDAIITVTKEKIWN